MASQMAPAVFDTTTVDYDLAQSGADAVSDWNKIMVSIVRTAPNPFFQGRFAAITELAVFEAVNACSPKYQPYLGTIRPHRVRRRMLRQSPQLTTFWSTTFRQRPQRWMRTRQIPCL